jgi:hypothetical protein
MCDWRLSHLTNFWEDRSWSRTPAVSDVGKSVLIQHVINVKTLNGREHDGRSFKRWYGFYAFTNQFLTTVCSTFNPTCDAQMRTGIHLLNVVWLKYDHFFYCKTDNFRCVREWRPFTHFPPGGVAVPTVVRKTFVFR